MLQAWGRGGVCLKRSEAREAGCGPGDVEVWRCDADLGTWRCLPQEMWSSGGMLRAWGRGGREVWSSGALEACCRRSDVEARSSVGTLLV